LGILIGKVESFLLENRAQIQEKGPFFSDSAEVENNSDIKTSALIELKGKQADLGLRDDISMISRVLRKKSNLLQDL
jgi:hypothetical protein